MFEKLFLINAKMELSSFLKNFKTLARLDNQTLFIPTVTGSENLKVG